VLLIASLAANFKLGGGGGGAGQFCSYPSAAGRRSIQMTGSVGGLGRFPRGAGRSACPPAAANGPHVSTAPTVHVREAIKAPRRGSTGSRRTIRAGPAINSTRAEVSESADREHCGGGPDMKDQPRPGPRRAAPAGTGAGRAAGRGGNPELSGVQRNANDLVGCVD